MSLPRLTVRRLTLGALASAGLTGAGYTLLFAVASMGGGIAIGFPAAILRMSRYRLLHCRCRAHWCMRPGFEAVQRRAATHLNRAHR